MRMRIRKLSLLLISIVLLVTFISSPVSAYGKIDTSKKVSVTIDYKDGGMPVTDCYFEIYKVADINSNAKVYVTSTFKKFPVKIDGKNQEEWSLVANTLKGYVQGCGVTPDFKGNTDANGCLSTEFKPGLYLIIGYMTLAGGGMYKYTCTPSLVTLPSYNGSSDSWNYNVRITPKFTREDIQIDPNAGMGYVSRKILKIWDDDGAESKRPKSIKFNLIRSKKGVHEIVDTVELSAENEWSFKWNKLSASYEWTVMEADGDNYTVTVDQEGITYTVVNSYIKDTDPKDTTIDRPGDIDSDETSVPPSDTTDSDETTPDTTIPDDTDSDGTTHDGTTPGGTTDNGGNSGNGSSGGNGNKEKLPQTGLLIWPIPILLVLGTFFVVVGVTMNKKGKEKETEDRITNSKH